MSKKKLTDTTTSGAPDVSIPDVSIPDTPDMPAQDPATPATPVVPDKTGKYAVGSVVLVAKNADADLNGFKLFPQYKKYTYTVEAYDDKTETYSLRRLNLLLKLKEADIIAPSERDDSSLMRRQY